YEKRQVQASILVSVDDALASGRHVILEAGTGSGTAVAALVPALFHSYSRNKKVLYLTRTNSQQKQVVEEFKRIKAKAKGLEIEPGEEEADVDMVGEVLSEINREIKGGGAESGMDPDRFVVDSPWEGGPSKAICVALQGRNNMCPLTSEDPEFISGTPEELSKMCSERKRNTNNRLMGKSEGGKECPYYSAFLLDEGMEIKKWARSSSPTAEEITSRSLSIGVCPYEVTKALASEAVVLAAPYIFFLSPFIRRRLLEWMECSIGDLIVIVDEAHNLSSFARDLASMSLSTSTLRLALSEVETEGDHDIGGGRTIAGFIEVLREAVLELAQDYLIDEDGLIPPSSLSEAMMLMFRTNSNVIRSMASEMLQIGTAIQDQKKAKGRLPRSYIHRVAHFYLTWNELEFERYTPLIVKGRREGEFRLEAFAMDPSTLTEAFLLSDCSIHLSGTLAPLSEYRDTIGLRGDTPMVRLPPPFPVENRMVVYDDELSTNYELLMKDPAIINRYRERIQEIIDNAPGRNIAVFFPSFDLLKKVMGSQELEDGSTLPHIMKKDRKVLIEEKGSPQSDVMDLAEEFRASRGAVLVSVIGGRLSEGMDYPGEALEIVVLVGIPYPRPNARQRALSAFYDIRFKKGWEYTVHAPASRKIQQAIGRMIRSSKDRGFAFILDKRAFHFKEDILDLILSRKDLNDMNEFLHGKTYLVKENIKSED
ncbi:MAG: ATP-dependent DNA helicase, partial [Thermoplasmatota archaeon]